MTLASAALSLYRTTAWLATPFLRRHLMRRAQRGREDPARLTERFGYAGRQRTPGPPGLAATPPASASPSRCSP